MHMTLKTHTAAAGLATDRYINPVSSDLIAIQVGNLGA
jgi:hypothetical protein